MQIPHKSPVGLISDPIGYCSVLTVLKVMPGNERNFSLFRWQYALQQYHLDKSQGNVNSRTHTSTNTLKSILMYGAKTVSITGHSESFYTVENFTFTNIYIYTQKGLEIMTSNL
jgi:hypothetical protein